jgi:hypothetical protein
MFQRMMSVAEPFTANAKTPANIVASRAALGLESGTWHGAANPTYLRKGKNI